MLARSDLRRLLEYTGWANDRMLRACEPLTPEAFVRNMMTSYGGVRGTLVHVLSAEWIWQLVQHVTNHSTYHRGQVATLLRQLGARPISTDMHAWDHASL